MDDYIANICDNPWHQSAPVRRGMYCGECRPVDLTASLRCDEPIDGSEFAEMLVPIHW